MRHAIHGLLILVCTTFAQQIIDDDYTESWRAAGLDKSFAAAYDNALPALLVREAIAAIPKVEGQANYADGGQTRSSRWMPLYDADGARRKPLSAVEAAVHGLFDLVFGGSNATPIIGGEWWLRKQPVDESTNFHYDKDESLWNTEMAWRTPDVSTITHLSSVGSPTMIIDQTIGGGPSNMEPLVPSDAVLVHPKPGRHVIFRGNLHHGTVGELASAAAPRADRRRSSPELRYVLIINWWRAPQPIPPTTVVFGEDEWRMAGLLRDDAPSLKKKAGSGGQMLSLTPMEPLSSMKLATIAIATPGCVLNSFYQFKLPVPDAATAGTAWRVSWPSGSVLGPQAQLLPDTAEQLFSSEAQPIQLFYVVTRRHAKFADDLPDWMASLHASLLAKLPFIRIVLVDPRGESEMGFLKNVGLSGADGEAVAVDSLFDDQRRKVHALEKGESVSEASLYRLAKRAAAGRGMKEEL